MILFWIAAGIMTLVVAVILAAPLFDSRKTKSETAYALDVYRDQLAEIARDEQRGILNADQARAAQLEIERRILSLAAEPSLKAARPPSRPLVIAMAVLLPLLGVALYFGLGHPQLPGQPFAAREEGGAPSPAVIALREKLSVNPSDGQGWIDLGRLYLEQRQAQQASDAFARGIALGQQSASVYADYGRAAILLNNGQVAPEAEKLFHQALGLEPTEPTSRFFLALAKAQQGDLEAALTGWLALERDSPRDAPWRQSLSENIDKAAQQLGKDPATLPGREPGHEGGAAAQAGEGGEPSADAMQAAEQMTPEERGKFIQSMVDRLAARLKDQPNDLDGWLKLARAYTVLNQIPQAQDAWAKAAALAPGQLDVQLDYANALIAGRDDSDRYLPPAFIETVKRIRTLAPNNPLGLYYGGMVERVAGNTDAARGLWQQVLALLPDGSEQRAAMQREIDGLESKKPN
ncbi:c-type cytochrome biogenesis protein CcmI [Dongia soli]|uniref:C-type cytochrome biogenesis protein CcmI n=1 Tax=Dongia soli TaxID=600628 RepID=A0ABU5E6R4_9PROT|nr:c-type cytochrome biogenesis protein CcmI [Dongia soli]MDY0881873.1 c-type cytochrome biogenesis protein CcmI [Dongia soli]